MPQQKQPRTSQIPNVPAASAAPTIAQRLVGDVRVVVMGNRAGKGRLVGEFDAHIAEAIAIAPSVRAVLVVQLEGDAGMDATERKRLFSAGLFESPCAILMTGAVARLILTAVRWMGASKVSGFAPHQFDQACDYLRVSQSLRPSIASAIRELSAKVNPSVHGEASDLSELVAATDRVRDTVAGRLEGLRPHPPGRRQG